MAIRENPAESNRKINLWGESKVNRDELFIWQKFFAGLREQKRFARIAWPSAKGPDSAGRR